MADRLVVDSSVAVKWFLSEPYSAEARRILLDAQAGTLSLLGPDLINSEVGNTAWKKHTKQGMSAALAQSIIDEFQTVAFTFVPTSDLLSEAYRLAVAHNQTVYDAMYLALSVREGCQFVTADERLVNALSSAFRNVVPLANWS